jgi:CheY-specific phosphatase CheX
MTLVSRDGNALDSHETASPTAIDFVDACLSAAAADVWTTMLGWTSSTIPVPELRSKPGSFSLMAVNGCVGFAGNITGSVFLSCSEELARQMAAVILGADHVATLRDVCDVIAELTNMLAGGCVSRLRENGFTLATSIPNIIRGQSLQATSKDVTFLIQRRFTLAGQGEAGDVQLTALGKFE